MNHVTRTGILFELSCPDESGNTHSLECDNGDAIGLLVTVPEKVHCGVPVALCLMQSEQAIQACTEHRIRRL
jgi:hypothetical protein